MAKDFKCALSRIEKAAPGLWSAMKKKLIFSDQWATWALHEREKRRSIATVNGCFDLLHLGHLHLLIESKAQADTLLVALNSDEVIFASKGSSRPIRNLSERLAQIAALGCVDHITYFQESTPLSLLESVRPDVHVNGSEYGIDCIESASLKKWGARLHLVDQVLSYSTTSLLENLQKPNR